MTTNTKTNPEIQIRHIATGLYVSLLAYTFTEFSDTIDTQYNSVQTFGRMDPIVNYQGATRKISLGIRTSRSIMQSVDEGSGAPILNDDQYDDMIHKDISRLQKMQYPVYDGADNALTIQRPPIVAVRLGNLIRDGNSGPLICAMNGYV